MKALIYKGPQTVEYGEVPKPEIQDNEILMKIRSVGICGTDLHIYNGKMKTPIPLIMGHEFSGTVEGVGRAVKDLSIGDRVVGEHVIPCHACHYCRIGRPNLCPNAEVIGLDRSGALAEYLAIPADLVYKIPSEISFDEAALIEPLTIALYAIREIAGQLLDKDVAVIGQGPIGLLLDQAVKSAGGNVIGIETQAHRLAFALDKKWIDKAIDATKDVVAQVQAIAPGGMDIVIEAVGRETTAKMALEIAASAGRVLLLGVFEEPAKLDLMSIIRKELSVQGSWTCAFSFPEAIDLVAKDKVDLKSLITHRYAATDGTRAFKDSSEYVEDRIKTVINF